LNPNLFYIINSEPKQGTEGSTIRRKHAQDLLVCYPFDQDNLKRVIDAAIKPVYVSLYEIPINVDYKHTVEDPNGLLITQLYLDDTIRYFLIMDENEHT
jgi:hypothetical protein